MSEPIPLSKLPSVEWKPCDMCNGQKKWTDHSTEPFTYYDKCPYCFGYGTKPVLVNNPRNYYVGQSGEEYQLQLGKVFEIEVGESIIIGKPVKRKPMIMKFLPIRPFSPSDNSKMWVVKV